MRSKTAYSSRTRAQDGVTVFAESSVGVRETFVLQDLAILDALRLICRELDARPGSWTITVVSTPTTIYRDLQGSRLQEGRNTSGQFLQLPEEKMLGKIGRLDLLAGTAR